MGLGGTKGVVGSLGIWGTKGFEGWGGLVVKGFEKGGWEVGC